MTREEEFIQSLYDEANEQLKEVYKEQKENRDKLLQEIALIMLTYTVLDGLMSLKSRDKNKKYKSLSKLIINSTRSQKAIQSRVINNILGNVVKRTFNFYSYNSNLKDAKKIVEDNFKGKHFSTRVWENEKTVGEHLNKQIKQFLEGKINVNQIKKDIEKTYNINAYNAKRLTETEVARCSSNTFDRFCMEAGVKKVRYNATLCNTCDKCMSDHGKVFDFKDKKELPRHPLCHCFYTIEDHKSNLDKTDYMANRFVPEFGEEREVKLGSLLINEKKVSNSKFNMWTDIDATKKNKAVRLYEKKLKNIKGELPENFQLPKISIINFEKVGFPKEAIAGYNRNVDTIFINNIYDSNAKIDKYLKQSKGFFASIEPDSPLLHELGHKYHYDLAQFIANKKGISYNRAKDVFDRGIEGYILSEGLMPINFIENQLSGYAASKFKGDTRINEIIAEYFSIKSKEQSSDLVRFIDNYIKEVIKK